MPRKQKHPQILNGGTELVPIDSVQPHPRNVNESDLNAIVESIGENGFYGSLIVQKSTGYILAGTHRWRGMKQGGAKDIPVTFVDVDDDRALRIMLVDNRSTRLGHDDPARLAELLQELQATEGELAGTGFDGDDLEALLEELGVAASSLPAEGEDEAPEPPAAPVTVLGDLWLLGGA